MHVNIKDLNARAWLMAGEQYCQCISIAKNGAVEIRFAEENDTSLVLLEALRPIFINRSIIQQCGFNLKGNVYTNGLFDITIGGASNIYKITGHRTKRPFVTHLLSQLHIFQNIYRKEIGQELIFTPSEI